MAQTKPQQTIGYDASYFAPLAELENGHYWFEARKRIILKAISEHKPQFERFLEIGCGTGHVLEAVHRTFPDTEISAADYFREGLYFAHQRVSEGSFYQCDARQLPFDHTFDVIGIFDVIEHIEEDAEVVQELYRVTNPDGILVMTVPQHRFLWSVADEYKQHVRRYDRDELIALVEHAGYQVELINSFISLLFPLMILSRVIQQRAMEKPDRLTELQVHPVVNQVLSWVLLFEARLLNSGISFSLGGSLLLVARKTHN